ncbi:leucine-rich repeat domain-containing protein [bacterium]|nr:leucine-rich repeat domain-containing protein [bacterium]
MKSKLIVFLLLFLVLSAVLLFGCSEAYKLQFSSDSYTVNSGISFVPQIKIMPKKADYKIFSSNNTIAEVENNIISTKKEGVVTLTIASGSREDTATLYVKEDAEDISTDIILKDVFYISFIATNFEIADLENEIIQTVPAIEGNILNVSTPYVKGYAINGWYTDRECTKKYDMKTAVSGAFKLYCYLTEQKNSFIVINKLITGITYDNLEHSVLELPAKEDNGNEIIGIDDKAFEGDKTITKVFIPESYEIIGASAFAGCENLQEVVIVGDSKLSYIGTNAFGAIIEEDEEVAHCSKLTSINLPDSLETISAYAFYKCTSLVLSNIPSGLIEVTQYSFYGTQIAAADFNNVDRIYEGAFAQCLKLKTITNTNNIIYCDKDAFYQAWFYTAAINNYTTNIANRKDYDALIYADTILVGCYPNFGRIIGSGKVIIDSKTTLIANHAFFSENLTELTVFLDTEKSKQIIDSGSYNFIGKNAFNTAKGVCLVVGESEYIKYKDRYSYENYNYKNNFCTEVVVEVGGNKYDINYGKHTLLKFVSDNDVETYFYDKFTPHTAGQPVRIELGLLFPNDYNLGRINTNAFSNLSELTALDLYKTGSIADFAISNCSNLVDIDLTKTVNVTELESANSIQFSSISNNCKVYVDSMDLSVYQGAWAKYATAKNKLEAR